LKAELDQVESRLARLVEALVNGGPLETVVAQIKVDEERKRGPDGRSTRPWRKLAVPTRSTTRRLCSRFRSGQRM
jgi:hypothetical protein